jgi:transcriptional regulator with XRE-family HTH domain
MVGWEDMPMSPWSFCDLLRDDVDAWISREKEEARQKGQTLIGAIFRNRLAGKLGVTPRQLDRYCAGETMPDADKLKVICDEIGSVRAVKHLARECGVGVYDLVPGAEAKWTDLVGQAARVIREAGLAVAGAMGADTDHDGMISVNEYRAAAKEIEQSVDALERLGGMLKTRMEEALRR